MLNLVKHHSSLIDTSKPLNCGSLYDQIRDMSVILTDDCVKEINKKIIEINMDISAMNADISDKNDELAGQRLPLKPLKPLKPEYKADHTWIPLSRVLRDLGFNRSFFDVLNQYTDPDIFTSPRLLGACLIWQSKTNLTVNDRIRHAASLIRFDRIHQFVMIDDRKYKVNTTARLTKAKTYQSVRFEDRIIEGKHRQSTFHKPIHTLVTDPDLETNVYTVSSDGVKLLFVPSHNRGKHILTVRVKNVADGSIFDLGTIRNHKGKLFFVSPMLATNPDQARENVKTSSLTRGNHEKIMGELDRQLSALKYRHKIIQDRHNKKPIKKFPEVISAIEDQIRETTNKLDSMKRHNRIKNDPDKIKSDLLIPVLAVCKDIGLNPNNFLKSLPKDSPLRTPEWWQLYFNVSVEYNRSKPMGFVQDNRRTRKKFTEKPRKLVAK